MANKIKGLTIEIGGDTTNLYKSMSGVNKQTRELSSELRKVDRLLKLDPKNTELLAQKQKILNESVGTTKTKLKELREAEKQVQAQFKKGKVSEDQVRALKQEIIKTEQELKKVEKTSKDFGTKVSRSFKNAGDSVKDFGGKVEGAGKKLTPLSVGAAGLLTGLYANVKATKEYREEMGKLETAFTTNGHSVDDAKEVYDDFFAILGEEDRSVEAVNHLAKLTTSQEELAEWTDIATGIYATFGDSLPIEGLTEAANETAKTGELTGVLADALNWAGINEDDFKAKLEATNTEKERSELITETLSGLYSESAEKYREVNEETIKANEAQGKMNDTMATLGEVMQPLVTEVLTVLTDVLQDVVEWISSLDEDTLKMILTITAVVAGLAPLLIIIGNIITVVGTITAALPALGAAFAVLTGPVGLVVAAIAAAIAIGVALYKNWDVVKEKATELWDMISTKFPWIQDIVEVAFGAIGIAVEAVTGIFGGVIGAVQKAVEWLGIFNDKEVEDKTLSVPEHDIIAQNARDKAATDRANAMGYHKDGLDYVPFDNYPALLHKGEKVLTAQEAREGQDMNHSGTIRVKGVNNSGELSGVVDIIMDQLRREVRMA